MKINSILKVVGGITLALGLLGVIIGGFAWVTVKQHRLSESVLQENLSGTVTNVIDTVKTRQAIQLLQLSEEVLAQSVRNYVTTGDAQWQSRYTQAKDAFDSALQEVNAASATVGSSELSEITSAAQRVSVINVGAMGLAGTQRSSDALQILDGDQYAAEKDSFERGILRYSAAYNEQLNDTLNEYGAGIAQISDSMREIVYTSVILTGITLLIGLGIVGIFMQLRMRAWRELAASANDMVASGLKERIAPSPDAAANDLGEQINGLADTALNSANQSKAVFEAAHEPLLVIDDDGFVRSANTAALDIFELPEEKLVGKSVDELKALFQPTP